MTGPIITDSPLVKRSLEDRTERYRSEPRSQEDHIAAWIHQRVRWVWEEHIKRPFHRVLDVGCNDGQLTRWLLLEPAVSHLTGIDPSEQMIFAARVAVEGRVSPVLYRYVASSIFDFPLAKGAQSEGYDTIICFELLEHLMPDEGKRMLEHVHGLLGSGGRFFLSTPHVSGPFGLRNPDEFHLALYSEESLHELILAATHIEPKINLSANKDLLLATWEKP